MKKIAFLVVLTTLLWSCKTSNVVTSSNSEKQEVKVAIDLVQIQNDKVKVTITAPAVTTNEITFHIPKIVPGTYSLDNYGKYIDDLKAFDKKGNSLSVKKTDDNSWSISNAKSLDKITYLVNDTYDTEKGGGFGEDIFSPAGTNIDAGKNIMLNTHGFVGYFDSFMSVPYQVTITHPATLWGATSMTDTDTSDTSDVFTTSR